MKLVQNSEFSKSIHARFYQDEFDLPKEFLTIDSVINEEGLPIVTGGIRSLYELILVTNKRETPLVRKEAFDLLLAKLTSYGLDLHVFIQDPKWKNRVIKSFGFVPTKGEALFLKVR